MGNWEGARRNSKAVSDLSLYFLLAAVAAVRRALSKSPHLGTIPVPQNFRAVAPSGHLLWSSVYWAMGCSQKPASTAARTDPSQSHNTSRRMWPDMCPVGSH